MSEDEQTRPYLDIHQLRWGSAYQSRVMARGDQYEYVDSLWSDVYEFETVAFAKPSHSYAYYPQGYHGVVTHDEDTEFTPPPIQVVTDTTLPVSVVVGDYRTPKPDILVVIDTAKSTKRAWAQDVATAIRTTDLIWMGGSGPGARVGGSSYRSDK